MEKEVLRGWGVASQLTGRREVIVSFANRWGKVFCGGAVGINRGLKGKNYSATSWGVTLNWKKGLLGFSSFRKKGKERSAFLGVPEKGGLSDEALNGALGPHLPK